MMNGNNIHHKANSFAVRRRGALHAGFPGQGGMCLATLLRQRPEACHRLPKDTAVIFLFLHGGPSQLETYDLKPNTPTEVRGPCTPISTNVQDQSHCEPLPLNAQITNRFDDAFPGRRRPPCRHHDRHTDQRTGVIRGR